MSFAEVEKFYGQLAKKNAIGEALGKRIRSISSEPELQKFIQEEILPLARKMGYDFSEKDLLEYEKVVARRLSKEDLLDVSGGISLKSALLSGGIFSLAMLGFGSIAPMQADAMVPKAAVESVTGGVVDDAKEDAVISVGQQINGAIKAELKGKFSPEDIIQPLMRIISVSNTTAEQKESAINLLLKLVSDDKKEDLKTSIETIKSTLPADPTLTEDVAKETLEEVSIKTSTNTELAVKLEKFLKLWDKEVFLKKLNFYRNYVSTYNKEKERGHTTLSEETFNDYKADLITTKKYLLTIYNLYRTALDENILTAENSEGYTFKDYQNICRLFKNLIVDTNLKSDSSLLTECSERGINFDNVTNESIQSAITTLSREAAPSGGLEAEKDMVLHSTGKVAKDSQEIEISQTDYGYLLDAWNGAEALVYKLTGLTENFRFLNPANRPTLEKKDGEKYFRWKYNEDSGDGFGELMRILFPCSDGQRIVTDGGAPNVPAFSRDCKPTAKLMAQIAALLYKYRTATPDEKKQIKSELENFIKELNKNQVNKEKSELEAQKQNFETRFNIYIDAVSKLATEQKNIFNDIFDNTIAEQERQAAKTKFENNLKALADSQKSVSDRLKAANEILNIITKDYTKALKDKQSLANDVTGLKHTAQEHLNTLCNGAQAAKISDVNKLLNNYNQIIKQLETIAHLSNYVAETDHFFAQNFADFGIDLSTPQGFVAANTLHRLLTSAFFAIDNQEYEGKDYNDATSDKFAPKYFVEKMLMNFCIEHFNSADELNGFYNEAKSLIKHNPTTASLTQAKESGERIENTLKLLNKLKVSELSPYTSGTAQNGATYQIGQVENGKVTFKNGTFADCADIAVRHVVNLLGYSVNKNWNVFFDGLLDQDGNFTEEAKEKLEKRLDAFKSAANGHTQFEFLPLKDRLQLFFYHQSKVGVDATDVITRTLWEYAICNMNDQANLENGSLYQIRYNKGNYELDTGHINSLKLVYNIAKALGLGTDKLDDAKAAIDELEVTFEQAKKDDPTGAKNKLNTALKKATTATYQLISPAVKVSVSAVTENSYQRDIWGKSTATVEKSDGTSSFDLVQDPGHGKVTHDPKVAVQFDTAELKSDVDKLFGKKTSDKRSDIAKKTQLNKFHMLFGGFRSKSSMLNPEGFKEDNTKNPNVCDPQYYKDFQALRFLKVAQGEEENTTRLKDELENNPYVRDSKVTINLREVQGKKTTTKEKPLALFAYDNYCQNKAIFFGCLLAELNEKEIDFRVKHGDVEKVKKGDFTYTIKDGKVTLAMYDGKATEIIIHSTVNGVPVTKTGARCFYQAPKKQTIEKVTIPSTVKEIGKNTFSRCALLHTIKFESNSQLKIIENTAFNTCTKLSKITIPRSVERIKDFAFYDCVRLENIAFEKREKPIFIEPNAFTGCRFSNIDFPHNVEFGDNELEYTRNLKTLTFTGPGEIKKENILKFFPYAGAGKFFKYNIEKLFDGKDSMQIDDKLTIDLWGGYLSEDGTLDLSSFDKKTFETFTFARNNCVKRVIWPQGIDTIPERMFSECSSLEEVTIPNTVNEVGKQAFYGCSSLEEVTIPNTVNEVGEQAFYWCVNLAKVAFEAGRTKKLYISNNIFNDFSYYNHKLTEVTIVDKITLYSGAFDGRKLEKIVIDADAENVQFKDNCFGYNGVNENLRIYVRDNAMKEKITKDDNFLDVKPENVIVGLPNENK